MRRERERKRRRGKGIQTRYKIMYGRERMTSVSQAGVERRTTLGKIGMDGRD
jgi:hypothetical protein